MFLIPYSPRGSFNLISSTALNILPLCILNTCHLTRHAFKGDGHGHVKGFMGSPFPLYFTCHNEFFIRSIGLVIIMKSSRDSYDLDMFSLLLIPPEENISSLFVGFLSSQTDCELVHLPVKEVP